MTWREPLDEGAEGLVGPGKLSRALFEFKPSGFANVERVSAGLDLSLVKFY